MAGRVRQTRDTLANWTTANPVIPSGMIVTEIGAITRLKVGNGTDRYLTLPYTSPGSQGVKGDDGAIIALGDATKWVPGLYLANKSVYYGTDVYYALVNTSNEPPHADWQKLEMGKQLGLGPNQAATGDHQHNKWLKFPVHGTITNQTNLLAAIAAGGNYQLSGTVIITQDIIINNRNFKLWGSGTLQADTGYHFLTLQSFTAMSEITLTELQVIIPNDATVTDALITGCRFNGKGLWLAPTHSLLINNILDCAGLDITRNTFYHPEMMVFSDANYFSGTNQSQSPIAMRCNGANVDDNKIIINPAGTTARCYYSIHYQGNNNRITNNWIFGNGNVYGGIYSTIWSSGYAPMNTENNLIEGNKIYDWRAEGIANEHFDCYWGTVAVGGISTINKTLTLATVQNGPIHGTSVTVTDFTGYYVCWISGYNLGKYTKVVASTGTTITLDDATLIGDAAEGDNIVISPLYRNNAIRHNQLEQHTQRLITEAGQSNDLYVGLSCYGSACDNIYEDNTIKRCGFPLQVRGGYADLVSGGSHGFNSGNKVIDNHISDYNCSVFFVGLQIRFCTYVSTTQVTIPFDYTATFVAGKTCYFITFAGQVEAVVQSSSWNGTLMTVTFTAAVVPAGAMYLKHYTRAHPQSACYGLVVADNVVHNQSTMDSKYGMNVRYVGCINVISSGNTWDKAEHSKWASNLFERLNDDEIASNNAYRYHRNSGSLVDVDGETASANGFIGIHQTASASYTLPQYRVLLYQNGTNGWSRFEALTRGGTPAVPLDTATGTYYMFASGFRANGVNLDAVMGINFNLLAGGPNPRTELDFTICDGAGNNGTSGLKVNDEGVKISRGVLTFPDNTTMSTAVTGGSGGLTYSFQNYHFNTTVDHHYHFDSGVGDKTATISAGTIAGQRIRFTVDSTSGSSLLLSSPDLAPMPTTIAPGQMVEIIWSPTSDAGDLWQLADTNIVILTQAQTLAALAQESDSALTVRAATNTAAKIVGQDTDGTVTYQVLGDGTVIATKGFVSGVGVLSSGVAVEIHRDAAAITVMAGHGVGGNSGRYYGRRSYGTTASPSQVTAADVDTLHLVGQAYDNTGVYRTIGGIRIVTAGATTSTDYSGYVAIDVVSGTTSVEAVRFLPSKVCQHKGGVDFKTSYVTGATYPITDADNYISLNSTGTAITFPTPSAANVGRHLLLRSVTNATHTFTIGGGNAFWVSGAATINTGDLAWVSNYGIYRFECLQVGASSYAWCQI